MRRLLYLPAVVVFAWTIGSTTWSMVDVATNETVRTTETFPTATGVVLDNGAGGIEVVGDRVEGVVVEVARRQGIRDADVSTALDDQGRLVISSDCPDPISVVCRVEATVHVPAGTPVTGGGSASVRITDVGGRVDLDTSSGSVSVTGAEGSVRVRTSHGRVSVFDSDADVHVRTSNGAIDLDGVTAGTVDAVTSNGRIRLGFSNAPDRITATSSNGRVSILLPADAPPYAVSATTSAGSSDTDIRTDPEADRTISATTSNGRISIGYR